ncbi:TIGR03618 family F420-dependent PPOX class oxidoreductase [Rhodococcus artemisiae]|uniref:TIGR03618 family F420-dependent PPOX class oxidoreductase n=1 Tax=Rhodococcus artemisiae TaxID=714159 RepID=A0ABU7LH17_9NOCA|nr:TIGR03618 family F420-dependent PPOX class oxidoreductase [Rhodococcus artemisiae]MEE2060860.1 TIGR03618 family F420-dependent PPOX class oxidoreductase [Rhodococcus artemisiae]
MSRTSAALGDRALEFLSEYHLATLTTLRKDGTPHVVAVGFTWDADTGLVRIITSEGTQKALNVERGGYAAVSQIDGRRWLTLEGPAHVTRDSDSIAEGERLYAARYREPRPNPRRVVIEIVVERVMGSVLDPT